jgi:hypothetical protein
MPGLACCIITVTSGSVALQAFIKAVRSFNLKKAFPNMESHPYDWRVDKYEPHRVWFTVRNTATHTGPLSFAGSTYKPTGKVSALLPAAYMAAHAQRDAAQLLMACSARCAGGAGRARVPVVHIQRRWQGHIVHWRLHHGPGRLLAGLH